jgi:hypothetical protein
MSGSSGTVERSYPALLCHNFNSFLDVFSSDVCVFSTFLPMLWRTNAIWCKNPTLIILIDIFVTPMISSNCSWIFNKQPSGSLFYFRFVTLVWSIFNGDELSDKNFLTFNYTCGTYSGWLWWPYALTRTLSTVTMTFRGFNKVFCSERSFVRSSFIQQI